MGVAWALPPRPSCLLPHWIVTWNVKCNMKLDTYVIPLKVQPVDRVTCLRYLHCKLLQGCTGIWQGLRLTGQGITVGITGNDCLHNRGPTGGQCYTVKNCVHYMELCNWHLLLLPVGITDIPCMLVIVNNRLCQFTVNDCYEIILVHPNPCQIPVHPC